MANRNERRLALYKETKPDVPFLVLLRKKITEVEYPGHSHSTVAKYPAEIRSLRKITMKPNEESQLIQWRSYLMRTEQNMF